MHVGPHGGMLKFRTIIGGICHDIEEIIHWFENQIIHVYVHDDGIVEKEIRIQLEIFLTSVYAIIERERK